MTDKQLRQAIINPTQILVSDGTEVESNLGYFNLGAIGRDLLATATQAEARDAIGAASRASILAAYNFGFWHPINLSFGASPAPSTGTQIDSNYVTFANSSGVLTTTLDVVGTYLLTILATSNHAASFSAARLRYFLGGTATLGTNAGNYANNGLPNWDSAFSTVFAASGTAGQTVTIQPFYEVTGSGLVTQHTARFVVNVLFCGV